MATIRSFRAYRPRPDVAGRVAALPYDVYNRQEAEIEVKREPLSFLKVDRAETSFGPDVDTYAGGDVTKISFFISINASM